MEYEIKEIKAGTNWVSHKRAADIPQTFKRKSQALAYLIDYAGAFGAELFHETDTDHPECIDVLVCKATGADQFTIEPVGFKLN
jgi:hypothetical protein